MRRKCRGGVLFGLIFSLLLAGCGSGGDGDTPVAPPVTAGTAEGIWSGPSSNGRTVWGAVLDDGAFYFLYSEIGDPTIFRGALVGNGRFANGSFSVPDWVGQNQGMTDFNMDEGSRLWANATGTYQEGGFLRGTMTLKVGGGASFNLVHDPASDEVPDLAKVAGTYPGIPPNLSGSLHANLSSSMTIVIDASGKLDLVGFNNSGLFSGPMVMADDRMTGTLTPRAKGHVYDFTLMDNAQLPLIPKTYRGVALFDPPTNQLSLLAVDPDHSTYFIHRSTKQ